MLELEECLGKLGMTAADSCRCADVKLRTFWRWMRNGDAPSAKEPYRTFCRRMLRANAHGTKELLKRAHVHSLEDGQMLRYLLSMRGQKYTGKEERPVDALEEAYASLSEQEVVELFASDPKIQAAVAAKLKALPAGDDEAPTSPTED